MHIRLSIYKQLSTQLWGRRFLWITVLFTKLSVCHSLNIWTFFKLYFFDAVIIRAKIIRCWQKKWLCDFIYSCSCSTTIADKQRCNHECCIMYKHVGFENVDKYTMEMIFKRFENPNWFHCLIALSNLQEAMMF